MARTTEVRRLRQAGRTIRKEAARNHRIALALTLFGCIGATAAWAGDDDSTAGIPGARRLFRTESVCIHKYAANPDNNYVNYWPAIGAPEHTDNIDTGTQPCATFTGSFGGQNRVLQHVSDSTWPSIQFIVFSGPYGAYLQGGAVAPPVTPGGSSLLSSTQRQVSRNGRHPRATETAAGPNIYKFNRDTGALVASAQITVLGMPPTDANYDGFKVAPDDKGAILMKT
ncbi:MAG: hypothetical protein JOY71_25245 [Acetobacteraceae bacterium]|nr:hypothetical protein [Acetobacteraceae bacterium]